MSDINDLILHAAEKNPVEFASTFNSILHQRCADAIDAKRVDIAQSLYSQEGPTDEPNA